MSYNQDWSIAAPSIQHTQACIISHGYGCTCGRKERRALVLKNDWELAVVKAKELGCVIVSPEAHQLFIDIDAPEQLARFAARLSFTSRLGLRYDMEIKRSKTEGHFHIVLGLPFKVGRLSRIILQWFFGSDPKRERLSFRRLCAGSQTPTIFFEKIQETGAFR